MAQARVAALRGPGTSERRPAAGSSWGGDPHSMLLARRRHAPPPITHCDTLSLTLTLTFFPDPTLSGGRARPGRAGAHVDPGLLEGVAPAERQRQVVAGAQRQHRHRRRRLQAQLHHRLQDPGHRAVAAGRQDAEPPAAARARASGPYQPSRPPEAAAAGSRAGPGARRPGTRWAPPPRVSGLGVCAPPGCTP